MRIEQTILFNLLHNEDFYRKVLPFLSPDYFADSADKYILKKILAFEDKYASQPSKEVIAVELESDEDVPEGLYQEVRENLDDFKVEERNIDWLIDQTEEFCKDRAIYNAIMESIKIIDGSNEQIGRGAIPDLLSEALAVGFNDAIGHDFFENAEDRFDAYQRKENKLPFDLEIWNEITNDGVEDKTLNVLMAGTGVGKTLSMVHMAAGHLTMGYNVLYVTFEMAEERIAKRIDSNLLNLADDDIDRLSKTMYVDRVGKVKDKTNGRLIIKEYPPTTASCGNLRGLLKELSLKKDFVPDVIYLDYLNLIASFRVRLGKAGSTYEYVKAVAEEVRGLAVEQKVPIITATQLNRSGYVNSDPGLEDTSESFGLPATADFMIVGITSEELEDIDQIMWKQLKNRYQPIGKDNRRFMTGVDRSKAKLYDVEQSFLDDKEGKKKEEEDDIPVFDKSSFGRAMGKPDLSKLNLGE